MGCFYAGVGKEALEGVTPKIEQMTGILGGEPQEIELYTIKNKNGEDATFAVGKFRGGFDLRLVADNGMMMRT